MGASALELAYKALGYIRAKSPIHTGNLRYNAIRVRSISPTIAEVYVSWTPEDGAIAPYMPYTNEVWISPRWHGKKNPNEGWWNGACEYAMKRIADESNGKVKRD